MSANRRKFPRVKIHVPVTCRQVDDQGKTECELIGVALDISLGGLLVNSLDFVTSEFLCISFIDIEDRLAQIECKMAYSRKTDKGMVHTGLSFQGSEKEKSDFVAKMIRAYFYRERAVSQVSRPAAKAPPPKGVHAPASGVWSAALEERRGAP